MAVPPEPESYYLDPTPHVPNSRLPVLIYRSVLLSSSAPSPSPESIKSQIERNHWYVGGQWKAYKAAHFHSVSHECYAVFRGRSKLRLGVGPLDLAATDNATDPPMAGDYDRKGVDVELSEGDIVVLPAGVSHHSLTSESDYEYVGLYPEGSPHWDNNFCKADTKETAEKAETAKQVPIPNWDPIYGEGGPLCRIWREADGAAAVVVT